MAPGSREEAVEAVRQRTDIVELIGRYVKLKKTGGNFVGLCPFHAEKTPSFTVSPRKGFFHCFGCKASGDVFSFLMKIEGKDFGEALETLAERAGVELPRRAPGESRRRELASRLFEINEWAAKFYEDTLWSPAGQRGRQALAERGVSEATAREFRLGYAPSGKNALASHLAQRGADPSDLDTLGLVLRNEHGARDLFRDRLVFPILGLDGRVRGFGARKLDPEDTGPKYINSRQSPVFDKGELFFGLFQARAAIQSSKTAVVVEGYFDVITPSGAGVANLVATCGTAMTEGHARWLKRLADRVVTLYDADPAGLKGSLRAAETLIAENLAPYMVYLPEGEDPDSFVRKSGVEAFRELLSSALPAVEVLAKVLLRDRASDPDARASAMAQLVPVLAACRDPIRQGNYFRFLADRYQVAESFWRQAVAEAEKKNSPPGKALSPSQSPPSPAAAPYPEEETLAALAVRFSRLRSLPETTEAAGWMTVAELADIVRRIGSEDVPDGALLASIRDESLRSRLAARLMDDAFSEEQAEEAFRDCIKKLKARQILRQIEELEPRLRQARQDGDSSTERRLLAEKLALSRERDALGVPLPRGGRA